jgi:ATP-dependent Lon protease
MSERDRIGENAYSVSPLPVVPVRDTVHFPGVVNTLHVARTVSMRAVRKALDGDRLVLVLSQRDMSVEDPRTSDLYSMGTLSEVLQSIAMPDTSRRTTLRGLHRARVKKMVSRDGTLWATIEPVLETDYSDLEMEALARTTKDAFTNLVHLSRDIPPEVLESVLYLDSSGLLADTVLHHLPIKPAAKQTLLEEIDHKRRLEGVLQLIHREEQLLGVHAEIRERVNQGIGDNQREFFLREQLRVIQAELRDGADSEASEYEARAVGLPAEVQEAIANEAKRLARAPAASPESWVCRNYLDTVLALPWNERAEERVELESAKRILEERHHGLQQVKDRVLDLLAVRILTGSIPSSVLCFVGPPGVGKTSVGRSIADALGRPFARIALGGVRDEAEIRGHRRTYVGAMLGRILSAFRQTGVRNPVIALDEIDKIAGGGHGDPAHALLEVLDTEQNRAFLDHFLDVPFDLSDALFIATANTLDPVPAALRDRMEIIEFPGYTVSERIAIAREHLAPAQWACHGLPAEPGPILEDAWKPLVELYTREAGVRELDQRLALLARKLARAKLEGNVAGPVSADDLERYLGPAPYAVPSRTSEDPPGTAWSLVVSSVGGDAVAIEVAAIPVVGSSPQVHITGSLGSVMRESAETALTLVRSRFPDDAVLRQDLHIHVPSGAVPKDGPSAGLAIAIALASVAMGRAPKPGVCFTGEITLTGRVIAVGGISDKLQGALRRGFREVIAPAENAGELRQVPEEVRDFLHIHEVSNIDQAIALAF